MKTVFSYKVQSVTATEAGRTARVERVLAAGETPAYWSQSLEFTVPVEVACDPGDKIKITVEWSEQG